MQPIKEITDSLVKYILPDECTQEEKEANPIAAQEVVDAIKAGKSVEIINAVIEGPLELESVVAEGKITIQRTRIKGPVDCSYAQFKQVLNFHSSAFESNVIFTATIVEKDIILNRASFHGEAKFSASTIKGNFHCRSASFKKWAYFTCTWVARRAVFTEVVFKKRTSFNSAQIGGHAFFNPATFEGEADFAHVRIRGSIHFTKALFKQRVSFNSAEIQGHAFFRPTTFESEANFAGTWIDGTADFGFAQFKKDVLFRAGEVKQEARFWGTVFDKTSDFQNISFRSVFFAKPDGQDKTQFKGKIDLRGCTYDRIFPIFIWEELMDRLDPYDRQPFTQLEQTFRRAGYEGLANQVYYKRRCREFSLFKKRNPFAWVSDRFVWLLTGYGVGLRRLLVAIALVLIIGTFIFHIDGAVEPKQSLTYPEAFWVSLNQFLPVAIPSGSELTPSSQTLWGVIKFTSLATLWKLFGWILVPVGVAGLSGWLKR